MRFSYDRFVDGAVIRLVPQFPRVLSRTSAECGRASVGGEIRVDLTVERRLVALELIPASKFLPVVFLKHGRNQWQPRITIEHDRSSDTARLKFVPIVNEADVKEAWVCDPRPISFHLGADGKLLYMEIREASKYLLASTLAQANERE